MMSYLAKAPTFNAHMRTEFPYLKMATDTITIFAQCHCQSIRTAITGRQDAISGLDNERIRYDVSKRRHERTTRKTMRKRKLSRKLGQGVGDVPLNIKPCFLPLPPFSPSPYLLPHLRSSLRLSSLPHPLIRAQPNSTSSTSFLPTRYKPSKSAVNALFAPRRAVLVVCREPHRPIPVSQSPWCDKYYGWVMWSAIPAHQHPGGVWCSSRSYPIDRTESDVRKLTRSWLAKPQEYHRFRDFAILGYLPRYSITCPCSMRKKGEKVK
ncbi:hypothetical protein M434DRAFT_38155 [Hypoxylon sp. CO27-5]|nr:hypothetical protein M434DRAFT_38155 [Hypoxylon sp. CO27-5]